MGGKQQTGMKEKSRMMQRMCKRTVEGGGRGSRQRTGSGDGGGNKCTEEKGCNNDERSAGMLKRGAAELTKRSGNGLSNEKYNGWGLRWTLQVRPRGERAGASANDTVHLRTADCFCLPPSLGIPAANVSILTAADTQANNNNNGPCRTCMGHFGDLRLSLVS